MRRLFVCFMLCAVSFFGGALPVLAQVPTCSNEFRGNTPLPEMLPGDEYCRDGTCTPGGLYPGGWPIRPPDWDAKAQVLANSIEPLDANGNPDPNGKIVMMSIGMSNTRIMYQGAGFSTPCAGAADYIHTSFMDRVNADSAKNLKLVVLNGSKGGPGAGAEEAWGNPTDPDYSKVWQVSENALIEAGTNAGQVQVVWMKHASHEFGSFPDDPQTLQGHLENITREIYNHWPNTKILFLTSRTYSYVTSGTHAEPSTYEGGLAVRWMIEKQMSGDCSLNWDLGKCDGVIKAPFMVWSAYFWNDGIIPRSDGKIWTCGTGSSASANTDNNSICVHPNNHGAQKNADELFAFFKTDPLSTPWYLKPSGSNPPIVTASANVTSGPAPLTVNFTATASDPGGSIIEYVWTYGDGTYSYNNKGIL